MEASLPDVIAALDGQPPWAGLLLVAAVAALENLFPVLPADVVVLAAAVLAASAGGDPVLLGVVAGISNAAGAFGIYWVVRRQGPRFLGSRLGRMVLRPTHLRLLRRVAERHGWWAVGAARALPGIRSMVPVVAGLGGVRALPVMLPTLAISSLWYGTIAWLGGRAGADLSATLGLLSRVGGALTLLALAGAAAVLWAWWRFRREAEVPSEAAGGPQSPASSPPPTGSPSDPSSPR